MLIQSKESLLTAPEATSLPIGNNPETLPEKEEYKIELKKDSNGLGITIAGYVCEKGTAKVYFN